MSPLISQPVFQLYALCSALLVAILYGLGFYTAKLRAERKQIVNHEDRSIFRGDVLADVEHPDVLRIKRAHLNSLENAVPFFVMGFIYSQSAPSVAMAQGLFFAFVTIRLFHAIFYLTARQPFRTLSFVIGGLINLTMAVQVVRAVL